MLRRGKPFRVACFVSGQQLSCMVISAKGWDRHRTSRGSPATGDFPLLHTLSISMSSLESRVDEPRVGIAVASCISGVHLAIVTGP